MNVTNTSLVLLISACNLTWADDSPLELTPLTVGGSLEQSPVGAVYGVAAAAEPPYAR